jgi:hypothetical protein
MGNGRVLRQKGLLAPTDHADFWPAYADGNQLFLNDGGGVFTEITSAADGFLSGPRVTRGLATGDIDDDGDLDVVTSEVNGPARLFLNVAERRGNWLLVRAIDPRFGERDAYGSTVTVLAKDKRWSREVNPASSYLSSSDPRVHFGLGTATAYDRIEVQWFDGAREIFPGGPASAIRVLRRGDGQSP